MVICLCQQEKLQADKISSELFMPVEKKDDSGIHTALYKVACEITTSIWQKKMSMGLNIFELEFA